MAIDFGVCVLGWGVEGQWNGRAASDWPRRRLCNLVVSGTARFKGQRLGEDGLLVYLLHGRCQNRDLQGSGKRSWEAMVWARR